MVTPRQSTNRNAAGTQRRSLWPQFQRDDYLAGEGLRFVEAGLLLWDERAGEAFISVSLRTAEV
jgi:hypothetical protein